MNLVLLILYGLVNIAMVVSCLIGGRGRFYEFPFWAGLISLGWFYPQAVGGYFIADEYPLNAYADSMLFASLCNIALWIGFAQAKKKDTPESWLAGQFDSGRLYQAAVFLSLAGFFFQWKLWSLPEEMLAASQWSGAAVKYLFFASIFKFGFLTLWLLYLSQTRLIVPKLLVFIVPCLLFLLQAALLRGRRSEMMNLFSYLAVSLWLVRRISIPRWLVSVMMAGGLILINGIGTYRNIMKNKELSLSERITEAANADYLSASRDSIAESGSEFTNYIYYRQTHADLAVYDFGLMHWNRLVFNYVPGQIIGRGIKESLYIKPDDISISKMSKELFGHVSQTGSTQTGYKDAFGSFSWFGFIKFGLIGCIMGSLYRHAMHGRFLGQLLYLYLLTTAMQSITHGTNDTLVRIWIYFFFLCYPALYWAKIRGRSNSGQPVLNPEYRFPAV